MNNMNPEQQHEYLFPERHIFYAGFWRRFAAVFIDSLVVLPLVFLVRYFLGDDNSTIWSADFFSLPGLVEMVIRWLYEALGTSGRSQATFGKRMMEVEVCTTDGARISFGKATARHFAKYLSLLIILIGYLMMIFDVRKQTLHDKIAGTLVVKV